MSRTVSIASHTVTNCIPHSTALFTLGAYSRCELLGPGLAVLSCCLTLRLAVPLAADAKRELNGHRHDAATHGPCRP